MEFNTIVEARAKGLIQLSEWEEDTADERQYIEREAKRIMLRNYRVVMYVRRGREISLWTDDYARTSKTIGLSCTAVRG
jgi:hypothetical protein